MRRIERQVVSRIVTVVIIGVSVLLSVSNVTPARADEFHSAADAAPGSVAAMGPGFNALPAATRARVQAMLGQLPPYFIENRGQVDGSVAYYVQGRDTTVYFTSSGVTFAQSARPEREGAARMDHKGIKSARQRAEADDTAPSWRWVVKQDFVEANQDVRPMGQDPTEAVISYFKGSTDQWRVGLPTYSRVVYADLWPGIDLVYCGGPNELKYEFIVQPGANPGLIRLAYRGATGVTLDIDGGLEVETPAGGFRDAAPVAYQEKGGQRVPVGAGYDLAPASEGRVEYGFRLGRYDRTRPLTIDPAVFIYCGYIGGSGFDLGQGIAVDGAGNAYVTGHTSSSQATFPETVGPDLEYNGGGGDAFVAKVRADGRGLVYCGYIGGSGDDRGNGIAVDEAGNAYVIGYTDSSETQSFPVTVGPDLTYNGGYVDAFVAKVGADGTGLVYCGYIGGSERDYGRGVAVDGAGNAYVTGYTWSSEASFPVTVGPDLTHNTYHDAFVAKVAVDGTGLVYCGYIGGSFSADNGHRSRDYGKGIAVDGAGNAYVIGDTECGEASFPVTVGPDLTYNGGGDAFVAKVGADGTGLIYCGYIGGSSYEWVLGITVDGAGNAYVTGGTWIGEAESFPVTVGPDLTYNGGGTDAFVAKVGADGTGLVYCGYIGGSSYDWGNGIAVDGNGNAYVTGYTESSEATFPVAVGPELEFKGGGADAFVAKVGADGTGLIYCGYIGGSGRDEGNGIAVDRAGSVYVTGRTQSSQSTFPETVGPDLTHNAGGDDAFVAKVLYFVATHWYQLPIVVKLY